ncbi:hypothetical protein BDZ45DRAFT_772311 [Acephala macrosclerotiorum]|nr:hypothetical protein BDZ45DRAFT_772311 [Acephala macrosclerotiorum]
MAQGYEKSIYHSLDKHAKELRFVTFKSLIESDPIKLEVHVHEIDKAPAYRALSYVWGSQAITKTIVLGATEIFVTINLYAALSEIRRYFAKASLPAGNGYLWVDAISINQRDDMEKNH